MFAQLEGLLTRYEASQISRRQLLVGLSAMVMTPVSQAAEPAVAAVDSINHVTVFVRDVQKSVGFYQRLFAMPVLTRQGAGVNLRVGSGFLGIYPSEDGPTGIDHVCFGLKSFEADAVQSKLADAGVSADIRLRGETKELYFTDGDDVTVQLQHANYRGGVGPLGDRNPP